VVVEDVSSECNKVKEASGERVGGGVPISIVCCPLTPWLSEQWESIGSDARAWVPTHLQQV
jgi:hypothetical protein